MRRATVTLTGTPATAPVGPTVPKATTPRPSAKPAPKPASKPGTPKATAPKHPTTALVRPREEVPDALALFQPTTFGDGTPKRVDWKTRAALEEAQALLGYPLTVVQGSYHQGVSASAGTHDGGGVVDLLAWDWQRKVKALRKVGSRRGTAPRSAASGARASTPS